MSYLEFCSYFLFILFISLINYYHSFHSRSPSLLISCNYIVVHALCTFPFLDFVYILHSYFVILQFVN